VQVDPVNAVETFLQANTIWALGILGTGALALWKWLTRKKTKES
jgi:hypothetical protein